MKISALRLFNVKRFAGRGVAIEGIGDGVNVLCAANEYGKSTSFEALHALFFQPYSGTPGDVQRLRPYSGGNPLIEVDVSTTEGSSFRITKQYYSGRSARVTDIATGRLVAQADEAENFIANLLKGGTTGPAGLLWVRQGVTGIEKRSRSEEDSEKQVRASLLESVQGEVEAITGGRRMAAIMAATAEALSDLLTATGRPKTGGRYAAAIEVRDRLALQEQKLSSEVSVLREALDRRAAAMKRLTEIDGVEDKDNRRRSIEAAQAAFDAAKAHSEMLKTAQAELKLARERKYVAERELKIFQTALEKVKELHLKLQEAEQIRTEAICRRRDAARVIETARADAEAAESAEQEARTLLARLETALRAREAWERIADRKERLGEAETIRQQIEECEAKLALIKIPPAVIDDLQVLEIEIAKLRAIEEAARPSVTMAYETETASRVTMDGTPLISGEERGYDGQAQLSIPGVGTITLRSNHQSRSNNRLEQTEAKRRSLLALLKVDDLSAARAQQVHAQHMEAELRAFQSQLSLLAPEGLAKLRQDIAALGSVDIKALELKEDPAQVRTALIDAEERRTKTRQALREVEPLRASADDALIAAEATLASFKAECAQYEAILGSENTRGERGTALSRALDDLNQTLAGAEARVENLRGSAIDLEL